MSPEPAGPVQAAEAADAGCDGAACGGAPAAAGRLGPANTSCSSLETYTSSLETTLALKSALLEEAVRVHRGLEARMDALEQGVAWKDSQLVALARQHGRASQELAGARRDRDAWRERAGRLEEEFCIFHAAAVEVIAEGERLRRQVVDLQQQLATQALAAQAELAAAAAAATGPTNSPLFDRKDPDAVVRQLTQQLKESHQKTLLLQQQLQVRSAADGSVLGAPLCRVAAPDEPDVTPELSALPYAEAWAAVGLGAADRLCSASPHSAFAQPPPFAGVDGVGGLFVVTAAAAAGGVNVATGGQLPEVIEELGLSEEESFAEPASGSTFDMDLETTLQPQVVMAPVLAPPEEEEEEEDTEVLIEELSPGSRQKTPSPVPVPLSAAAAAGGASVGSSAATLSDGTWRLGTSSTSVAPAAVVASADQELPQNDRPRRRSDQFHVGGDDAEAPPAAHVAAAMPGGAWIQNAAVRRQRSSASEAFGFPSRCMPSPVAMHGLRHHVAQDQGAGGAAAAAPCAAWHMPPQQLQQQQQQLHRRAPVAEPLPPAPASEMMVQPPISRAASTSTGYMTPGTQLSGSLPPTPALQHRPTMLQPTAGVALSGSSAGAPQASPARERQRQPPQRSPQQQAQPAPAQLAAQVVPKMRIPLSAASPHRQLVAPPPMTATHAHVYRGVPQGAAAAPALAQGSAAISVGSASLPKPATPSPSPSPGGASSLATTPTVTVNLSASQVQSALQQHQQQHPPPQQQAQQPHARAWRGGHG